MDKAVIGIKIADGSYFPILAKDDPVKKKVILTTVKDEQQTVQIDLFQGYGEEMSEAQYLGSLLIDNLEGSGKGTPEIELILGFDADGNLMSRARDRSGTGSQSLAVNLQELPDEGYDVPDFQMESEPSDVQDDQEEPGDETGPKTYTEPEEGPLRATPPARPYENGYTSQQLLKEPGPRRLPIFIGAGILLVAVIAVLLFFLWPWFSARPANPSPPQAKAEPPAPAPAPQPQPAPAMTAEPPVAKPESTGVWYYAVRGDNLWNLSKSFYRNPWLYRRIAEENALQNPDLILVGERLYIPDVETGRH